MILQDKILIKINSRNFNHYKNFIENIKNNQSYEINVKNILPTSHSKLKVMCDICGSVSEKPYREYMNSFNKYNLYSCSPKCSQFKNKLTNYNLYGVYNTFQSEETKKQIKETNLKRHGVEFPSQSSLIREKSKETSLKKYGVEWASKSEDVKNKIRDTNYEKYGSFDFSSSDIAKKQRIERGQQIPDELKSEFEIYRNIVRSKTQKVKNKLLENWNGLDFYDNENISNNFDLPFYDKDYPTIDHKKSIYYGFINGISPEIIADFKNLCITKRGINASKNTKCI